MKSDFDEKDSSLSLLKSPSGPSYSDSFGIIEDTGSTIPPICIWTSSMTSILDSMVSQSTPTETITSLDCSLERNDTSTTPYIPWWPIKMIEAASIDVGNICTSQHTCSHKQ